MFDDIEFREVFGLLDVDLHLERTEYDPAHPTTPVLYFFGNMQDPSMSRMTGRVKMTVDNQIQWHFVRLRSFLRFQKKKKSVLIFFGTGFGYGRQCYLEL